MGGEGTPASISGVDLTVPTSNAFAGRCFDVVREFEENIRRVFTAKLGFTVPILDSGIQQPALCLDNTMTDPRVCQTDRDH